jgi:hypothetical protein
MPDSLITALLGRDPAALHENVSFAPPLTLARIVGRAPVSESLDAYARCLGATEADLRLHDEQFAARVLTGTIDGHTMQVMAIVSRDERGLIAAIDMYGRPWPYMALLRDRLAGVRPSLTAAALGDQLYVPDGPGNGWIDAPPVPPLAADVSFHSPVLTAVATGKEINERILAAASQVYGEQKFRAVLEVEEHPAIAAVFDGLVDGNALQLVAMFGLNERSEINEIRIFSRPWPVTTHFRSEMYELLKDVLGPSSGRVPTHGSPRSGDDLAARVRASAGADRTTAGTSHRARRPGVRTASPEAPGVRC